MMMMILISMTRAVVFLKEVTFHSPLIVLLNFTNLVPTGISLFLHGENRAGYEVGILRAKFKRGKSREKIKKTSCV